VHDNTPLPASLTRRSQTLFSLRRSLARSLLTDCKLEKEFFGSSKSARKVVVPFKEYVLDPSAAVAKVYKVIGSPNGEVPAAIKQALAHGKDGHESRGKMKYFIKLTLGEFGVDAAKDKEEAGGYW
jgi:hypothetical protein